MTVYRPGELQREDFPLDGDPAAPVVAVTIRRTPHGWVAWAEHDHGGTSRLLEPYTRPPAALLALSLALRKIGVGL